MNKLRRLFNTMRRKGLDLPFFEKRADKNRPPLAFAGFIEQRPVRNRFDRGGPSKHRFKGSVALWPGEPFHRQPSPLELTSHAEMQIIKLE